MNGTRLCLDVVEAGEVALELGLRIIPKYTHGIDVLIGACAAGSEVNAKRVKLLMEIAGADAEHKPTLAKYIERSDLFCQNDWVTLRY